MYSYSKKKTVGSETHTFVSSVVRMSSVSNSKTLKVFKGNYTPEYDPEGILIFLDMFPSESFPHLCRYVFVSKSGQVVTVDAIHEPSPDLHLERK